MQLNSGKASPLVFLSSNVFLLVLQSLIVTYYKGGVNHIALAMAKLLNSPTHGGVSRD